MKLARKYTASIVGSGLMFATGAFAQDNRFLSLKEVPIPVPRAAVIPGPIGNIPGPDVDLDFRELVDAGIVRDPAALIQLGKAMFWDMQAGSDGVQSCASCHFSAGADIRTRNQLSPGLHDTNFRGVSPDFPGDSSFGNSTVPFTANDRNTPNPPGAGEPAPGALDVPGFPQFGPNHELSAADFPLNAWLRPTELTPRGPETDVLDEFANVSRDTNDVVASQGVRHTLFTGVTPGSNVDQGTEAPDVFNLALPGHPSLSGRTRRVEPRNAPTVINAVFNFDNFWDGRASTIFNGVNPFGFRDRASTLLRNTGGKLTDVFVRVTNSSLASQAVGPTTSNFEMSWENRMFPDVGRKLLCLKPLAGQVVHPQDSVLGPVSMAQPDGQGQPTTIPGLTVSSYAEMVKAAFADDWWKSAEIVKYDPARIVKQAPSTNNPRSLVRSPGRGDVVPQSASDDVPACGERPDDAKYKNNYTQMEWNFSLFWGLAVQAYEATLVSNDAPFDRFEGAPSLGERGDPSALSASEQNGLSIFMDGAPNIGARCNNCHAAPVMTNHSALDILQQDLNAPRAQGRPFDILELMVMGDGTSATYDKGFYNIGVRRSSEDVARAGTATNAAAFQNPLDDNQPFPLSYVALGRLAMDHKLPPDVLRFVQLDPKTKQAVPVLGRVAINGSFKAPNLRNVQLTGPYFHNGDSATLRQVVEFYTRGGNFPNTNFADLDPDIEGIPGLRFPEFRPSARQNIRDLVNFVSHGLTDERVTLEKAPFDHPQLFVPNGSFDNNPAIDRLQEVPAVGRDGRATPIATFLELDPQAP